MKWKDGPTKKGTITSQLICDAERDYHNEFNHLHVVIDDLNIETYWIKSALKDIEQIENEKYKKLCLTIAKNLLHMKKKQRLKTIVVAQVLAKFYKELENRILYGDQSSKEAPKGITWQALPIILEVPATGTLPECIIRQIEDMKKTMESEEPTCLNKYNHC